MRPFASFTSGNVFRSLQSQMYFLRIITTVPIVASLSVLPVLKIPNISLVLKFARSVSSTFVSHAYTRLRKVSTELHSKNKCSGVSRSGTGFAFISQKVQLSECREQSGKPYDCIPRYCYEVCTRRSWCCCPDSALSKVCSMQRSFPSL